MKRIFLAPLVVLAMAVSPAFAGNVGFSLVSVPDPPGINLQVGLWYPTDAAPDDRELDLFTQSVAPNGPIAGGGHAMVVISHGTGGGLASHYDTALALAEAGFVIAAMTHTGDNYRDQSRATYIADRPRAVHAVIDYVLGSWRDHAAVDGTKVGMFGFSSGGFTTLVSVGGIPDLSRIAPYCVDHAETFVCQMVKAHAVDLGTPIPLEAWMADPRIKAAVVAAPAIGFTFTASGLERVRLPIQLWRAADDHILPAPDYADAVRAALPVAAEFHDVPGADHFDFLAPCSEELARVAPEICTEKSGFDRSAFHSAFNRDVVAFFRRTLAP